MSGVYLKVKIKSLAAEAKIIRQEERKWLHSARRLQSRITSEPNCGPGLSTRLSRACDLLGGLGRHRKFDVREESRASLLAYGFLRGRRYSQMEAKCYEPPRWSRVADLVKKYGPVGRNERPADLVKEWAEAGP